MSMATPKRSKGSSITRVLEIMEAISQAERPLFPFDLAIQLDIPKPSIHRLLQQLESEGFVQTDIHGSILAGDRSHAMAMGLWHNRQYKMERLSILTRLTQQIGETCGISILDGTEMLYTDRVQTNWPLQIYLPHGSRVPIWCTASGKLWLSSLPTAKRQRIMKNLPLTQMTRNTLITVADLEAEVHVVGQCQLGTDNEEFIAGMVACSVPIFDPQQRLIACLYTHAPTIRKSLEDLKRFEPDLKKAASELSRLFQ